ncbi:MAG: Rne/Rng family ribonuclease [Candidatus Marinimicrobia bacterium]|nr:Rne/Rng family ribonuclease [Candidatus Neomarinimicrobiota bacterium]MBL7023379.1 Rne/Rng family ribonuclease [Candidatus Neomarinimicrobiota bacterium]MBL7109740.1 Rne/Rng family ribonuclease [Candidatus Neomarinimicrobiota bacterium]
MVANKEIFINVSAGSTRIAIVEDEKLVELYIELPHHQRMVGNIYKGKIQNVIPGMQAAFVDIGYNINAFLPFSEIESPENLGNFSISDDDDSDETDKKTNKNKKSDFDPAKDLKTDDEILVQVIKEPYAGKGPRVTTDISLPGSLLVLVPKSNFIGISRKMSDKYEKRRLRRVVKELKSDEFGLIVRTIAEGKDHSILEQDYSRLLDSWKKMDETSKKSDAPVCVYQDYSTADQVIRDLFTVDVSKIVVDSKVVFKRIAGYIKEVSPNQIDKLVIHKGKGSVFDQNNIEEQVEKSLRRKVWMKSGAHLVIEQTEAMLVIDVNSGRFIGKKDHEQNSLKINIESAKEIARQLRLRDLGGLIVIDFIDLQEPKNRKKVFDELKEALKSDRAKVSLSEFSNFGLLEMTRQRIRQSLLQTVSEECPTCRGLGRISSKYTVLTKLENWLKRFRAKANDRRLILYLHPELAEYIKETKSKVISGFMWENWMLIEIKADQDLLPDKFRVFSKKRKRDVTSEV